jgi:isopenicillin-N N-acyltransferase-like protein
MTDALSFYHLEGDWFDMGRTLGENVSDQIRLFNDRYFSDPVNLMRFGLRSDLEAYTEKIGNLICEYCPDVYQFIKGIAEGADLPVIQILMQSILPELTHVTNQRDWPKDNFFSFGCTGCLINADYSATGAAMLGQNWDFNILLPNWYLAELIPEGDKPRLLIVGAGAFFCCSGLNSSGLAVSFTSSGHLPNVLPQIGLPLSTLLLESLLCESFQEARDSIVAPKRAGSANILLSDGQLQNTLIEVAGSNVEIIEEEPILVCGNHFQHPRMIDLTDQEFNPASPAGSEFALSSIHRAERLRTLLKKSPFRIIERDYLIECLKDHDGFPFSVCCHEEGSMLHFKTLGSMIIESSLCTIRFSASPLCSSSFETFRI